MQHDVQTNASSMLIAQMLIHAHVECNVRLRAKLYICNRRCTIRVAALIV